MGAGHAHALYVHGHSRVHRLPPQVKLVAAFGFVLGVAVTPPEAVAVLVVDGVALAAAVRFAQVPAHFVLARMVVVVPFVLAALLIPFVATDVGGGTVAVLGRDLPADGLLGTWNVIAKATLGAATSILLTATTETPTLLRGLDRLHVPPVLTQIAAFMVRYLEIVAGELRRQRVAMTARGHDPRWLWQVRPLTASVGSLFVRGFERGERVHAAMLARGYTGVMPRAEEPPATSSDRATGAALPAVAAVGAAVAWTVL